MNWGSCVIVTASLAFAVACWGAEEPTELKRARTVYEKEMEAAARPVRERYLRTLTGMKETLTRKGELEAALLVEHEMTRIAAASGFAEYAGDWTIIYDNGAVRHYTIEPAGDVAWTDSSPPKKAKLTAAADHCILDFGDGKVERLRISGSAFRVEHFDPAAKLAQGDAGLPGKAKRSK